MFIKRCWPWLCLTWKLTVSSTLGDEWLAATPNNCDCWLHGYSNKRPRKWSWNLRHNTGNLCGLHWNATGSRYARSEKMHAGDRERCIWRRHSPIVDGEGARGISLTPNVW